MVNYVVCYRAMEQQMIEQDGLRRAGGREEVLHTLQTGGSGREILVDELEGDMRYWDITVRAITEVGLESAESDKIAVQTKSA